MKTPHCNHHTFLHHLNNGMCQNKIQFASYLKADLLTDQDKCTSVFFIQIHTKTKYQILQYFAYIQVAQKALEKSSLAGQLEGKIFLSVVPLSLNRPNISKCFPTNVMKYVAVLVFNSLF